MKRISIFTLLVFSLCLALSSAQSNKMDNASKLGTPVSVDSSKSAPKAEKKTYAKKIAITFDYLPGDQIYTPEEIVQINDAILATLKKYNAPAAGFVVGEYIEGTEWEIVVKWLDQGHIIGFLTYSGQGLYDAPLGMFIKDVMKGKQSVEDLVTTYHQQGRYFRYPFLHYPADERTKQLIIDELVKAGIRIAHASVVTEDFVYNMTLEKILPAADSATLAHLEREYLDHILERLGHFESVAQEVAGRPVRQILQLRVNRLNAMFLDDVLAELQDKGYQFVDLHHALGDWVYRKDETYFGTMGLSYLERIKFSDK